MSKSMMIFIIEIVNKLIEKVEFGGGMGVTHWLKNAALMK